MRANGNFLPGGLPLSSRFLLLLELGVSLTTAGDFALGIFNNSKFLEYGINIGFLNFRSLAEPVASTEVFG